MKNKLLRMRAWVLEVYGDGMGGQREMIHLGKYGSSYCQLDIWEEETSVKEWPSLGGAGGTSVGYIRTTGWLFEEIPAHCGQCHHGQVVPGLNRKQRERK